jgi:glycosyltransferase involved in cell wall biosynthesis
MSGERPSRHAGGQPAVSVIVPAYDSVRTIARCLRALQEQSADVPFEVIIVDSGVDDTAGVALRVMPQARIIRLPQRALAAEARNVGAAAARGEILAFIDSDAYADRDWIANVVRAAASGYDLVCGSVDNANPASAVGRAEQLLMFNEFLPDLPAGPSWFALSGNMVMSRRSYSRFGPFAGVRAAEDVVFSRRLVAAGGRILFFPALRIFHDNRVRLGAFLRNQFLLGKHTLLARRVVAFSDTSRYWLVALLLPVFPIAKLAKIAGRMLLRAPYHLPRLAREFPLVAAGVCAYGAGMARGVVARRATVDDWSAGEGQRGAAEAPRAAAGAHGARGGARR